MANPCGLVNRNAPSSRRCTSNPPSCTSRWWVGQSRTRLSSEVSPPIGPVPDVMAVEPVSGGAAGEAAPAVAARERAAHRRRDAAGAAPDAERLAVRSIDDGDDSGIAAQPPGGLRRDGGAILDFAAPRAAVGEHVGLDMDHDFVPVGCKHRRIARLEQPLGHPRQCIGPAHRARRPSHERPTWDVGEEHLGVFSPVGRRLDSRAPASVPASAEDMSGRDVPRGTSSGAKSSLSHPEAGCSSSCAAIAASSALEDARPHLGWEPSVQDHGAVILVPEGQAPVLVLRIGPLGLLRALRPAIQSHELLYVLGGAVEPDVQQVGLVLRKLAIRVSARALE